MGRIQTGVGLASGLNITDIVTQLMAFNAKPRDNLKTLNETLTKQQTAVTELETYLLSTQYVADNLGKADLYTKRTATSSNPNTLTATVTGTPAKGTYVYTPVQSAQAQQYLSSGVSSTTQALGGGTVSFRYGDNVQRSTDLSLLNGGTGFTRGKIRITDRSGTSAQIDLSTARSMEDVLEAINSNTTINVLAQAEGDHLKLIDNTDQTVSNLKVQEVGSGKTAASLGLAGINAASDTAQGQDLLELTRGLSLDALNDGSGVASNASLADIQYTLRDGSTGTIDFSPLKSDGTSADTEQTLGDLLDTINAASPNKLHVEIAADGDRLEITDLTEGTGTFSLSSLNDSPSLQDLGLDGTAVDGVLTGRRLLGGLQGVLLSSLNGGKGLGTLGSLQLTDRSGATASVDLSAAETLQDVVTKLNAAGLGITAAINDAQTGIELTDTTGASASNLIVANGDATKTADRLQIASNAQATQVNSGDLHLQVIAENTRLADMNGGTGVAAGKIKIIDSSGSQRTVDLSSKSITTIGDVLKAINRAGLKVRAEINETGDGIRLRDTGGGNKSLAVAEVGTGTTAAGLHLLGGSQSVDIDGSTQQVIDGTTTCTLTLNADETLQDLQTKINALGGVTASTFNDGSSNPYRLSLTSKHSGKAGRMVVDTSGLALSLRETVEARDALLVNGRASDLSSSVLISSSSNKFSDVLPGVTLEVKDGSTASVTVSITDSDTDLVANLQTFVTNYNKFRSKLSDDTKYDSASDTKAVLTGDSAALRLETETADLLSRRYFGVGSIQSLGELGVSIGDDGQLTLDANKLKAKYADDPDAVKEFFTTKDRSFSAKFSALCDQLAGQEGSLLVEKLDVLDTKITTNKERIEYLTERLTTQENRLYTQFYNMENAISKMKSDSQTITSLFDSLSASKSSNSSK